MIKYKIEGSGSKVIVFLHGWGGNLDSFQYLNIQLQKEYRCICVQWEIDSTKQMGKEYSIFCYASEVFMLLQNLNISKVHLVGHSFGGRVAILLASVFDIQIEKLVLLDSAGLKYRTSIKKWLKKCRYQRLKKKVEKGYLPKSKLQSFASLDYARLLPTQKVSFQKVIACHLEQFLPAIDIPTLAIWGEQDTDTPLYFAKKLRRKIKFCEMIVYPNCGHFAYLEKPYQTYLIIKSFFGGKE